jgi:hypothetical protein
VKGPEYDKIKIDHYIYIVLNDRSTNTKKKSNQLQKLEKQNEDYRDGAFGQLYVT